MKTEIDLDKLPDGCKSHLLAEAEEGLKPSEAIIRILERESFRRGFRVHLTTPRDLPRPKNPKKPAERRKKLRIRNLSGSAGTNCNPPPEQQ